MSREPGVPYQHTTTDDELSLASSLYHAWTPSYQHTCCVMYRQCWQNICTHCQVSPLLWNTIDRLIHQKIYYVSWSVNSLWWWHMWMGLWLGVFPFEFNSLSLKALPCQISHFLRYTYFVRIFSFGFRWPLAKIKVNEISDSSETSTAPHSNHHYHDYTWL